MTEYYVGQKILIRSVNERGRGPVETTVTKVGTKLVYVHHWGRDEAYRIETGRRNDAYEHQWLETPEQYAEELHRSELWERLRVAGLASFSYHGKNVPTEKLERVLAIMEDSE